MPSSPVIDISKIVFRPVDVTYLEMLSPVQVQLPVIPGATVDMIPKPVPVDLYRQYYYGVGAEWHWLDRMVMDDHILYERLNASGVEIFILKINNTPAGFTELVNEGHNGEILYFGLFPEFIGKGYGKYFLHWSVQKAWSYGINRLLVNTCSLDHPNAVGSYRKAGFSILRTVVENRRILLP